MILSTAYARPSVTTTTTATTTTTTTTTTAATYTERHRSLQHRTSVAHYRPVSTILLQPAPESTPRTIFESRSRLSARPATSTGIPQNMKQPPRFPKPTTPPPPLTPKSHLRNAPQSTAQGNDRAFSPQKLLHRIKRKRSLVSLSVSPTRQHPHLSVSPLSSSSSHGNSTKPVFKSPSVPAAFAEKDGWIRRDYATLHPYPNEAPYMQAYDPILLDNDRYTNLLLSRLTPEGSPTFHNYGKRPPQSVLDLGCGLGHWILTAAEIWKSCQFIGFDLVDLTSHIEKPDNVKFVRGNFLKRRLPFVNKQFDLVRMANLSLCIPYAKWESLLMEAFRVLTVGGRLELVDDEIIFPYGPTPKHDSKLAVPAAPSIFDLDDDDDDDDDDSLEDWSGYAESSFYTDHVTLFEDKENVQQTVDLKPLRYLDVMTKKDSDYIPPALSIIPPTPTETTTPMREGPDMSSWAHQATQCCDLETIFHRMLKGQYGIHPRPSEFLLDLIRFVFGHGNAEKRKSHHLKLAPANASTFYGPFTSNRGFDPMALYDKDDESSTHSSDSGLAFPPVKKPWINFEREKRNKNDKRLSHFGPQEFVSASMPDRVSAKAAGRLGITYSALAAATAASVRHRTQNVSSQSPGLILWPSTYFPMCPSELEMHACKNLHVLLGCKHALFDYLRSCEEKDGTKYVENHVFNDVLWEYECFRRRRFHWPCDTPDVCLEPQSGLHSMASKDVYHSYSSATDMTLRTSAESPICPYSQDELTHVRTIRVFEAVKSDDYSLATLQYPRYPVPSPPGKAR
ncbi:hypothetical protein AX17_000836 [Amanita inopinata Kibby_2008]|nr:hypothetical protein AX17_000836 [Amanita inopinata Kibby_2008]